MSADGSHRQQFIIEQYKNAVAVVDRQQKIRWEWQKFGIISTFAFYAFLFSTSVEIPEDMKKFAYFLPVLLNVLGLFVSWSIRSSIIRLSGFIRTIEAEFDFCGWETWKPPNEKRFSIYRYPMTISGYVFWIGMISISLVAARLGQ